MDPGTPPLVACGVRGLSHGDGGPHAEEFCVGSLGTPGRAALGKFVLGRC